MMVARRGVTLLATAAFAAALFGASSTASAASIPASTSMSASVAEAPPKPASADVLFGKFINHTTENFIKIRNCPGTNCGASGQADLSHALEDYCWAVGEAYPVAGAIFWDNIKDLKTGRKGWINEYYLQNKGQETRC